jgi:hypothetical protein
MENKPYSETYDAEIVDPEILIQNNNPSENAIKIFGRSRTIRILALFHGILNLFNAFFQFWFFALFSLLCYFGYKGAKEYNNNYTIFYLFYVVLDFIGQIVTLVAVEQNKDEINANNDQWNAFYVLQSLVFLIQIWIICIVYNFMRNLKEISQEDLNILRGNHPLQNVRFVLI